MMIRTFCFLLLVCSISQGKDLASPFRSTVDGITIPNTHQVMINNHSARIYRGNSPTKEEHILELLNKNIKDILVFKNFNTPKDQDLIMGLYANNGYTSSQVRHLPMPWRNIKNYAAKKEACRWVLQGLQQIRDTQVDMFFHCTVGEDRTGLLAGLAHIVFEGWSVEEAFQKEMCARGYEAGNPRKSEDAPHVVQMIRDSLTPLFLQIATITKQNPNWTVESCNYLPKVNTPEIIGGLKTSQFRCEPQSTGLADEEDN